MAVVNSAKYISIFLIVGVSSIFMIVGLWLITTGAISLNKLKDYNALIDEHITIAIVLPSVVEVLIVFTAVIGCFGAWMGNKIGFIVFGVLLGIIVIVVIAGGIAGNTYQSKAGDTIKYNMQKKQKEHSDGDVWDTVQKEFKCCSTYNYTEWQQLMNGSVTYSCCRQDKLYCMGAFQDVPSSIYTEPCLNTFTTFVEDNIHNTYGFGMGLVFVQIPVISICCLCFWFKKDSEKESNTFGRLF